MNMRMACIVAMAVLFSTGVVGAQEMPKQITFGAKRDMDPMVSPNGNHLAFASNRTGKFDIFMLTFGKSGVFQLTQSNKDDRYPSWSPDSRKIVFSSKRTGRGDLYEMAYDGSAGYLQLTDRQDLDEYPSYTSNGQGLLYATAPKKALRVRPKMKVVVADEKGRANSVRPLAEGDEPRLAPNGRRIVFVSRRTKNNDIWLMERDGASQMQLTTDQKDDETPCFSPDSREIVFASNRTGNFDIWVMDADGSNQRQLTSNPADEKQPCWSSGGYIYFTRKTGEMSSNIFRIEAP
ncbi:MAG: hypothetical protein GWP08_18990 [Nitrospiraceae bacterium]|nr:hypothetical protein [Nitrospiraceae bacterium]